MKQGEITGKNILAAAFGVLLVGIGVAFNNCAGFGNDPIGIVYDGIRNAGGMDQAQLGMASNVVNLSLLVLLFFIGRHYLSVGTFVYLLPYGFCVDAGNLLYRQLAWSEGTGARILFSVIGCSLVCLGVAIYITVDTLEYLKRGGRIRSAEALAGEILGIRPVIQIKGGLLEPYCKVRGRKRAKKEMEDAILGDAKALMDKYGEEQTELYLAHADAEKEASEWKERIESLFPGKKIHMAKLPLSICCHVGPGTIGVGVCVSRRNVKI